MPDPTLEPGSNNGRISALLKEDTNELYENAPCGYLSTLPDGTLIKVNATFLAWTGHEQAALVSKKRLQDLLPVAGKVFHDTHFGPLLLMQGYVKELAFEILCSDGSRLPVLLNAVLKRDEAGAPLVIRITLIDARGRHAYEEELRRAKRKAEEASESVSRLNASLEERVAQRTLERDRIWRNSQDMLVVGCLRGRVTSFNPAFTRILGWTAEDMDVIAFGDLVSPDQLSAMRKAAVRLRRGLPVNGLQLRNRSKGGDYRWISWTVMPEGEALYGIGRDITEAKKREDALRAAELALRQAQKMEAIGKLTGGVAHDFNNILQIIAGNLELLKLSVGGEFEAARHIRTAMGAVERGAKLASQLLAFARRQPLQPLPTNLGRILREMDELLRRALGETVEIETVVSGGLWNAVVDRNQLENAILNLAINARDAMQGSGKLTLEVGNALLDDHYAAQHPDVIAGQYIMLGISDTGCGMTQEVVERIFEPFFTTKPEGEGTGLGLSMVFGFVKQSRGHIKVYSEPGLGTTCGKRRGSPPGITIDPVRPPDYGHQSAWHVRHRTCA